MNFNSLFFLLLCFILFNYCSFGSTENMTVITICSKNSTIPSYCDCKSNVISCDLSSFKNPHNGHVISLKRGWRDKNNEIQRFCLCGGPPKSRILLREDVMFQLPRLHRVDLYNIQSTIHLRDSFSQYFSGDIYMSGVKINNIHKFQFGRGDTYDINNVSSLACCSKIVSIENYSSPVLYVENSTIAKIEPYGIDSTHAWSTVIMKNVHFVNIQPMGIKLHMEGLNISLTDCKFSKLNETAIALNLAENVLLSKNVFGRNCHPLAFGSVSTMKGSNLLLFENRFMNSMYMELDARENILVWFNRFNSWDNDTFRNFGKGGSRGRNISISFNVIDNVSKFNNKDIPDRIHAERIVLKENVLSKCDCVIHNKTFPTKLTDSRCEGKFSETSNASCHLSLEVTKYICKEKTFPMDACRHNTVFPPLKIMNLEDLKAILSKENITLDVSFFAKALSFDEGYSVLPITDDKTSSAKLNDDNTRTPSTAHKLFLNEYFLFIVYFSTMFSVTINNLYVS